MQGREKKVGDAKAGGEASPEDCKVVGKFFSSKIPSTKPIISSARPITSTVVTSMPLTRQISKGIVIGSSFEGGSGSKPKQKEAINISFDKGKTIVVEKSKE